MPDKVDAKTDRAKETPLTLDKAIEEANDDIPKLIKALEGVRPSENPIENIDAALLLESINGVVENILVHANPIELLETIKQSPRSSVSELLKLYGAVAILGKIYTLNGGRYLNKILPKEEAKAV